MAATKRRKPRMTNDQFVKHIMNNPDTIHFALMHSFVITALEKYAAMVIAAPTYELENGFVHPATWKTAAREVQAKLAQHFSPEGYRGE